MAFLLISLIQSLAATGLLCTLQAAGVEQKPYKHPPPTAAPDRFRTWGV